MTVFKTVTYTNHIGITAKSIVIVLAFNHKIADIHIHRPHQCCYIWTSSHFLMNQFTLYSVSHP